jgi:hypothetical protein
MHFRHADILELTVMGTCLPGRGTVFTAELPDIYQVRFELRGTIKKSGKFTVHCVNPLDGYPLLNSREAYGLAQALNEATTIQAGRPVTGIGKNLIDHYESLKLPRTKLQLAGSPLLAPGSL